MIEIKDKSLCSGCGECPEIPDETKGIVVQYNSICDMKKAITRIGGKYFNRDACIRRAKQFCFICKYKEYPKIFSELLQKGESVL